MKNIFALFVIFAGITWANNAASAAPDSNFNPGDGFEVINLCDGKCEEKTKPCMTVKEALQDAKCLSAASHTNAYYITNVPKCKGNSLTTECKWELEPPQFESNTDGIICKEGWYFQKPLMGGCDTGSNIGGPTEYKCCQKCPIVFDQETTTDITPERGATSPAECYVKKPNLIDIKDKATCEDSTNDGVWYNESCYKKQTENGNTFILIDDCHHNEYVAPATPASDE